jgi:aspartyl-tRNA(Asn)/glutamyl-tRNA(Gln) amidotransferase subunit A
MCLGALASQTGGSTTRPASFCGVCSIKPTWGRVRADGVLPLAPSLDHVGVMARCVRDLALLLEPLAGAVWLDPAGTPGGPAVALDGQRHDGRFDRLGGPFAERAAPAMRACLERARDVIVRGGGSVREAALPGEFAEVWTRQRTIMAVEAAAYHAERLRRHPDDYPPRIRELVEEGLACPAPEYARCLEHRQRLRAEMASGSAAPFLAPAALGPAPDPSTTGDAVFNAPWSYLGLPAVSVPAGRSDDGLPLAVQMVGRDWSEAGALAAALWLEERLGWEAGLPPVPKRE